MKTRKDVLDILSQNIDHLKHAYCIETIGVFGSVAREEQTGKSDVDRLVEFFCEIGMVKFLRLESELEKLLEVKVDLVSKPALKRHIGQRILQEIEYVN